MNSRKKIFILSTVLLIFITLYYFLPLLNGIVMGVVFAYVAKPMKRKLEGKIGKTFASLVSTLVIILPISFLMFYGIFQGVSQLIYILTNQKKAIGILVSILKKANIPQKYINYTVTWIPTFESIIKNKLKISAFDITVKASMFFMNFLISAIVCFYTLCDADRFAKNIIKLVPDDKKEDLEKLFIDIDEILISLWFGNFAFAILVGLISIPYFMIFGVPYIPLLSGLMFLAALIPVFAEWMVILPVTAYLAIQNTTLAIWFIVTGVVFMYILPEIILRPHLVGYTSKVHPLLLLLAFIGGAIAGGSSGFFLAPMTVAILTAIYNHYTSNDFDTNKNTKA